MSYPNRVLVIDGENLLHRSYWATYYACKDKENYKKELYVYFFLNTFRSYIRNFNPDKIICTWDYRDEGHFNERKSLLEDYKGNRVFNEEAHVYAETIRDILSSLGITQIHPLNREADDIIYWLCSEKYPGKCTMISADTDLFQLFRSDLKGNVIWNPMKNIEVNESYLRTSFGVADGQEFIIMKACRGDSSDNIGGIDYIRSTRIKLVIEALGKNYDFDNLEKTKLLTEDQIEILKRNLELMRLDKVLDCEDEIKFYEEQLNTEVKPSRQKFREYMEALNMEEILKKFNTWYRSFLVVNEEENLLPLYAQLF